MAPGVCRAAYERGLLMETSGPEDEVAKLLPPINIADEDLAQGLEIVAESVHSVVREKQPA
jgi:diaminobutyrate-2-oxoglutarate transaminase